jgi:hypothetical protein
MLPPSSGLKMYKQEARLKQTASFPSFLLGLLFDLEGNTFFPNVG